MSAPLTIAAEHPALSPRHGRTLASLPLSYRPADPGSVPQVMLVAGSSGWAQRAADAIASGCSGVIIADPEATAADSVVALADLADGRGAVLEFSERYAGNATLRQHRHMLTQHMSAISTVIVGQTGPFSSPATAALDMVRTLRALGLVPHVTDLWTVGQTMMLRGAAGQVLIEGMATRACAGIGQRIDALGFSRTLRLDLPGNANARPADIHVANGRGERKLPGVYESADRTAWIRMAAALRAGSASSNDLRCFADDVAMIGGL